MPSLRRRRTQWLVQLIATVALFGLPAIAAESLRSSSRGRRTRAVVPVDLLSEDSFSGTDGAHTPVFLLMSSVKERKVSYVELGEVTSSGVHGIIDAGLVSPKGIALSADGFGLFVADSGLMKILYFPLAVLSCSGDNAANPGCLARGGSAGSTTLTTHALVVRDAPVTVVDGVASEWVATDPSGALFFSDRTSKSVEKLPGVVVRRVVEGTLAPDRVASISQQEIQALVVETSAATTEMSRARAQAAKDDKASAAIANLYEADVSPYVGTPAGLAVDSESVFWANEEAGIAKGTVAAGVAAPLAMRFVSQDSSQVAAALAARPLANVTESARGVAVSYDKVVFTGASHSVYAVPKEGGEAVVLADGFVAPRGIAWDGDGTMFVADQDGNAIYSLPCGRFAAAVPSRVVDVSNPFGVAVFFESMARPHRSGGARLVGVRSSCVAVVIAAMLGSTSRWATTAV